MRGEFKEDIETRWKVKGSWKINGFKQTILVAAKETVNLQGKRRKVWSQRKYGIW